MAKSISPQYPLALQKDFPSTLNPVNAPHYPQEHNNSLPALSDWLRYALPVHLPQLQYA